MPSAAILEQKKKDVEALIQEVSQATSGVIVNYYKTNVEDDTKLRADLRKAGVEYSVLKNTMLRFVFNATNYTELNDQLNGMTAFAYSKSDAVAPAKVLSEFGKTHEDFVIKGGFVDGKVISVEEIKNLASLPSKEVLVAKALGSMKSPITGLVTVLNGNIRGLACALKAIAEKQA